MGGITDTLPPFILTGYKEASAPSGARFQSTPASRAWVCY